MFPYFPDLLDYIIRYCAVIPEWVWASCVAGVGAIFVVICYKLATAYEVTLGKLRWLRDDPKTLALNALADRRHKMLFALRLFAQDLCDLADSPSNRADPRLLLTSLLYQIPPMLSAGGIHRCAILVMNSHSNRLVTLVRAGFSRPFELDLNSCAGICWRTGETYYCRDKEKDPYYRPLPGTKHDYNSFICEPVKGNGKMMAILLVDAQQKEAFRHDDQELLRVVASHLSLIFRVGSLIGWKLEGETVHAKPEREGA